MSTRPGFNFLVCPDSGLIQHQIELLLRQYPPSFGTYERHVFWGDEGLGDAFWNALTLQNLMSIPKVIVLRRAQLLPDAEWDKFGPALSRFSPTAWPLFSLETAFDRGKPKLPRGLAKQKFWLFAEKKKWIWQSPGLQPKDVAAHVRNWARERNLSLAPGALEAICDVLPADLAAISQELAKIELACKAGEEIRPELAELVTFTPDMDIFAFIDSVQSGQAPLQVWRKVVTAQATGEGLLFQFLAMLAREARIMWQLLHGEQAPRLPQFVIQRKTDLARSLGPARLAGIWELALEAELRVKQGEASEAQAMESLVSSLSGLFRTGAGPASRR